VSFDVIRRGDVCLFRRLESEEDLKCTPEYAPSLTVETIVCVACEGSVDLVMHLVHGLRYIEGGLEECTRRREGHTHAKYTNQSRSSWRNQRDR
jgi:hypothetical protein